MKMMAVLLMILLASGCARSGAPPNASDTETPLPTAEEKLPGLTVGDLKGRIALHRYEFTREDGAPTVIATLENVLTGEPITIQLSTIFRDAAGEVVERTPWSTIGMAPDSRHQYFAQSVRPAAADADVQIRLVLDDEKTQGSSAE